jgi:hypothetical protein
MVTIQEPDQGGIAYALIYALKDQFNVVKSKGTMRQSKAENYSSGYFRMSKKPPIGANWLDQKLDRLYKNNSVVTSLKLNIDSYTGYWYPSRTMRMKLLRALHLINELSNEHHGQNCPQWSTLLSTVDPESNDYEVLTNGETQTEVFNEDEFNKYRILANKEYDQHRDFQRTRQRCGGISPCETCLYSLPQAEFDELQKSITKQAQSGNTNTFELDYALKKHQLKCNPYCQLKGLNTIKQAFK